MFHHGAKTNLVAIIVPGNCSGFPDFTKVNWISVSHWSVLSSRCAVRGHFSEDIAKNNIVASVVTMS